MTGIKLKLILAFLSTTTISLVAMAAFTLWSLDRGFKDYVSAQEQTALDPLHAKLTQYYAQTESWEALEGNGRLWRQLHRENLTEHMAQENGNRDNRRPPRRGEPPGRSSSPPPPDRKPGGLPSRIFLWDKNNNLVIGPPADKEIGQGNLQAIEVSGKIVGFLGLVPRVELENRVEIGFIEQQSYRLLMISLGAISLCLLIAIPLARQLIRPVNSLLAATRELTGGDLSARSEIYSQDELGQLTRDFNILAETLASNERDRKQWVSDISHELRTPLAVIRGQTEAMLDGIREPNNKELRLLNSKVLHLGSLIDDLYELSLSDQGTLNYRKEQIYILSSVEESLEQFSHKFTAQGISLTPNIAALKGISIFADPDRLQQLWSNLMSNTLRYTDSPGDLSIAATRTAGKVTLTFSDSFPGVDNKDIPQLFKRLFRVEKSRDRASGGAGLGLSICKNIVHAHGGTIEAQPSALGGLAIAITLPIDRAAG
ncbi:MAG: ATP-binding protein [Halioglobus sp.]